METFILFFARESCLGPRVQISPWIWQFGAHFKKYSFCPPSGIRQDHCFSRLFSWFESENLIDNPNWRFTYTLKTNPMKCHVRKPRNTSMMVWQLRCIPHSRIRCYYNIIYVRAICDIDYKVVINICTVC